MNVHESETGLKWNILERPSTVFCSTVGAAFEPHWGNSNMEVYRYVC